MFDLTGRIAVVTGASSGLGVQFAKALARQGADLIIIARRAKKLGEVRREIAAMGVNCLAIPCDVTNPEAVQDAADMIITQYGRVDILVNSAGGGGQAPVMQMSDEEWSEAIELDLNAVFRLCRIFGAHMIDQEYGRIINIASMYGVVGSAVPSAHYAAAKAGVINFSRTLAHELAPYNITVNALCPGIFSSDLAERTLASSSFQRTLDDMVPMKRPGQAGELDAALIYLASQEASYTTGTSTIVDGGYTCL